MTKDEKAFDRRLREIGRVVATPAIRTTAGDPVIRWGKMRAMNVVVKYAWFPPQTILDVGPGNDDLVFEHCTFMGGKVCVHGEVDRTIFVSCLFQGTIFDPQRLSTRIATDCQWAPPHVEDAMPRAALAMRGTSPAETDYWAAEADRRKDGRLWRGRR